MLVIKYELWPFGDVNRKRSLGGVEIWNKGGDRYVADYGWRIHEHESQFHPEIKLDGEIKNHKRMNSTSTLLYKVLNEICSGDV